MKETKDIELRWISWILRLSVASLFVAAATSKFIGGLDGVVDNFQNTFKDAWIPMPLVVFHAKATPYIEVLIPVWLLVGWKLRWAWVFTALFMITLAFGMAAAKLYAVAADNYVYVLIACVGLYFSRYE